jgi:hypothetical protein
MTFEAIPPRRPGFADPPPASAYPVRFDVVPQSRHNRLTSAFRLLLAIPYAIVTVAISYIASFIAVIAWFTIVFAGKFPRSLWQFSASYMMWRSRYYTYSVMLRDEYPPFGYGPYPAYIDIDFKERRSRLRTFFRALLVLPQLVVTWFITLAWLVGFVVAWFAILFTGAYPEGVRRFMVGASRWMLRLEAYMLLLVDNYPPFSLGLDEPSILPPAPEGPGGVTQAPRLPETEPSDRAAQMWAVSSPPRVVPDGPASADAYATAPSSDEPAFHDFPIRPPDDRGA